jgi:threonine dehydrogenase-like Zn-dependent dehydrogenase
VLAVVKERAEPGVDLREVAEPRAPGLGEVRLRVEACGLCGTDVSYYQWREHLKDEITLPVILGHEVVGVIQAVGQGVEGMGPGQRVATETSAPCGRCRCCMRGMDNLCESQLRIGQQVDGGLAPLLVVPASCLRLIPDSVPAAEATLIQTMGVAMHALEQAGGLLPGDSALVFGPGPVGALAALLLQRQGARVAVVGLPEDQARLEMLRGMGVEAMAETEVGPWLERWTGGFGVELAVEAAGAAGAVRSAMAAVRPGGTVVIAGVPPPAEVDLTSIPRKEMRIVGSWRRRRETWERATEVARREPELLSPLVGMRVPLQETADALQALSQRQVVKAVVVMG